MKFVGLDMNVYMSYRDSINNDNYISNATPKVKSGEGSVYADLKKHS